jgi:hypothetical protein
METVPQDVIQWILGPYLDQESMIQFNRVLSPDRRIYRKFEKGVQTTHYCLYTVDKWISILKSVETLYGEKRFLRLYRFFQDVIRPENYIVLQTFPILHTTFLDKCNYYSKEENFPEVVGESWKNLFLEITKDGLSRKFIIPADNLKKEVSY